MPRAPRSTSRRATAALTSTLLLLGVTVVSSPVAHGESDDDRSAPPAGADAVWPTPDWELGDQTGRAQRGGAHRAASGREFLGTDGAVYQSAPVATKGRNGTIYYGEEFDNARGKRLFRTDEDISSRGTRLTRLMLKRVDAVLLFQPSTQSPRQIEAELEAFMAPRLQAIGAAANAGYKVLPKPLSTDSRQFFAIARAKDDGIIDRINTALARIQQRPPN